jgi:hypothetical protein
MPKLAKATSSRASKAEKAAAMKGSDFEKFKKSAGAQLKRMGAKPVKKRKVAKRK